MSNRKTNNNPVAHNIYKIEVVSSLHPKKQHFMSQLHLTARFKIQSGMSDAFRSIASKCIDAVRDKEINAGCHRYDWYYNEDHSICDVLETYASNEAVFEHMGNVGAHLQELFAISEFSGTLYGSPSDALKKAMEGLNVTFMSLQAGA